MRGQAVVWADRHRAPLRHLQARRGPCLGNGPPFFDHFAASIRHQDNEHGSMAVYKFQFTAKPRCLRWLLHPIMLPQLRLETHKRLQALASFLARTSISPA